MNKKTEHKAIENIYIQGSDYIDLLWNLNWIREEERTSKAQK